jgi:REP element-mobilizing transposase RayT
VKSLGEFKMALYTHETLGPPAYQLRFSWTGWPSIPPFPPRPADSYLRELEKKWEQDGIRPLESRWTPEMIQYTVSVKPQVAPTFLAARLKGRLQHALRNAKTPVKFSRKVSVRCLGDSCTSEVERYIEQQVGNRHFADPRMRQFLSQFTVTNPAANLALPTESISGRYWYNLHLVLLVSRGDKLFDEPSLRIITDSCSTVAGANGYVISRQSLLPDHLHLALRGNIEHSPEEIALAFLNGLSSAVSQRPIWENGYYAGTFGEYEMACVRTKT